MSLAADFYRAALIVANRMREIPGDTDAVIYDPRFTDEDTIEEVRRGDEPFIFDVPRYYHRLFTDLANTARHFNCLIEVCDSDEIGEPMERGDFIYYVGPLTSEIGVLYMEPTHPIYYPYRCVLYGPEYQFEVSQEHIPISVYPVAEEIRGYVFIANEKERRKKMKAYLKETDRPAIFVE